MIIIQHRRNMRAQLEATPSHYGVEIDLRSHDDKIVLHHDPFVAGERFDEWIESYRHRCLILNVKEEGLESLLIAKMKARAIENYFFLDQSFPFLVRTARSGESRCAVRVSEFESIFTAIALSGMVEWVWVDCFTRFSLTRDEAVRLKQAGFKLCLVSPELQGRDSAQSEISAIRDCFLQWDIAIDAVCTKLPQLWES